jgi:beta-alanine degradation protein BauB
MTMKKSMVVLLYILMILISSIGVGSRNGWAQDPVKLRPDMFTVMLENDHVRVLEWTFKPGEKELPHTHPEMVTYILSGGKRAAYGADGNLINEREMKAGQVFWSGPTKHVLVNTGTAEIKAIIVEIKTNRYKD